MKPRRWGHGSSAEWLFGPGPMTWRRTFSGRPDQVTAARRFAASLFAGTGREDDVAVIVAELSANAVFHTRSGHAHGWFGLEVVLDDLACVAVTDLGGTGVPVVGQSAPRAPAPPPVVIGLQVGGRGLCMVATLAVTVGVHGSPAYGHTVWADLDLKPGTETGSGLGPDPASVPA